MSLIAGQLQSSTALAAGLDTWTVRNSGVTYQLEGVTYGNGQFVAVGDAPFQGTGLVLTSPDGVNWTSRNSGTPNSLSAIAYGNGQYVAVGSGALVDGGTILTSPDGITWTRQTPPHSVGNYLNAVTYGNGLFVIVGIGGAIVTSSDGVTWIDRSQETRNAPFHGILYANGQFVAVGGSDLGDSLIFTSPDGITWTSRTSAVTDRLYAIAYGNGTYVITGTYDFQAGQPVIETSPDAITWTSRTLFTTSSSLGSIAFGNGTFVAVGGEDLEDNPSMLITSTDGVTWTRQNSSTKNRLNSIANGGATFVAVGAIGTIIQSAGTATTEPQAAALTAPPAATPLPGATATFTWDAGTGVNFYWLYVGTTVGGSELFNSNEWVTSRTQTVNNLPQNGGPIYVRLYSGIGDTSYYRDYVYTAAQALAQAPDIAVQQPVGSALVDGTAHIDLGGVNVGSTSAALTFTILNSGTTSLTGLAVSKDGPNSADFAVSTPGAATLDPNGSTTFTVTFTPGGAGARNAAIHIASNVTGTKNPFDINLSGSGVTTTALPLAQALDASGLAWTTGGDADWSAETGTTHDGVDAAQSGLVGDSQESWLQTTVTGPGTLTFWWKVDSLENSAYLNFELDGLLQSFISGTVAWEQQTVPIDAGNHTVRWNYSKDVDAAGADAGWVDQVTMSTDGQPAPVTLSYHASAGKFTLAWPLADDRYQPESTDSLAVPHWTSVPGTPTPSGDQLVITLPATETARFFRLHQP